MTELTPVSPLAGLKVETPGARLQALDLPEVTWLAPWPGAQAALSTTLEAAHGLRFPEPNRVSATADARLLWAGRAQALLIGPSPDPALAQHGASIDVREVWAGLSLTGPASADVLARLVPLDLRPEAFAVGSTCRTLLGHISSQITAVADGLEILVMRSMADTAAHEIERAVLAVAARAEAFGEG